MPQWKDSLISPCAAIGEAVNTINDGGYEIALVADSDGILLGTVTDGDIRRALLSGYGMDAPVDAVMNRNPLVLGRDAAPDELLLRMNEAMIRQIPFVDDMGRLVGLSHIRDLTPPIRSRDHWVVLMAGGLGERLRPLTERTPKPLLTVGGKPILEDILETFVSQQFHRFYISVNYKADAIKDYFADGAKWGVQIHYLEEDDRRGTAGALRLMPSSPETPMIVMNGDLITRINYQDLLDYHDQQKADATMCIRQYDFQVPFGVVEIDGNQVRSIDEKPVRRVFVNAGIYVVNPSLIDLVPSDGFFDMTELFEAAVADGRETKVFPVHEYWLDVGREGDLEKAKREYGEIAGK